MPRFLIVLSTAAALTACGDRSPAPSDAQAAQAANPGSLLSSPKLSTSRLPTQASDDPQKEPLGHADVSTPVERYTDLNAMPQGMALSFVVTAKSEKPIGDAERLDRLSVAYHSQADVFKRQEIAKTELPQVDAMLQQYRQQQYYSLPIADYTSAALALTNLALGPYQPASKSFPVVGYGGRCWNGVVRNAQGAVLKLAGEGVPCQVVVNSEAVAREIETARAKHSLHLGGTAYLFVPRAAAGVAEGRVVRVRLVIESGTTARSKLGEFELLGG